MAGYIQSTGSLDYGSDQVHEWNCDMCLREKKVLVEAVKFCKNCDEFYCSTCLQYHQRFSMAKSHSVVEPSETERRGPKASLIHVGVPGDGKSATDVPGMCMVVYNTTRYLVVSDWHNKSVKVLDSTSYTVIDCVKFNDKPYGLTALGNDKIAVTFRDVEEINMLKISVKDQVKLVFLQKLSAPKKCRGITSVKGIHCDTLFIVSGGDPNYDNNVPGEVHVLNYGGMNPDVLFPLNRFPADHSGKTVFPRNVVTNKIGDLIYVSSASVGVIVYNNQGKVVRTLSDSRLQQARGLCIDNHGNIYVSGMNSANVMKFRPDGSVIGEILNKNNGLTRPISLLFDDESNRLYIGSTSNESLQVFQLCDPVAM